MKIANIAEADPEKLYPLDIPFEVSNGDSTPHTENLSIKYRALTPELFELARVSAARFVASVVAESNAEEGLSYEFLAGRDVRFVQKIAGAIIGDFTQR